MHESSSYWRVYHLSSVFDVYEMWTSHLFEFENQALCDEITYWWGTWFSMHARMWINSLIGWEQVREQVSTSVQQRDELDSCMQYELFTRMYGIMEALDFVFYRNNHDTQMINSINPEYLRTSAIYQTKFRYQDHMPMSGSHAVFSSLCLYHLHTLKW